MRPTDGELIRGGETGRENDDLGAGEPWSRVVLDGRDVLGGAAGLEDAAGLLVTLGGDETLGEETGALFAGAAGREGADALGAEALCAGAAGALPAPRAPERPGWPKACENTIPRQSETVISHL